MLKLWKEWNSFINAPLIDDNLKKKALFLNIVALVITLALFAVPYLIVYFTIFSIYSEVMTPLHIAIWSIPVYGNICVMFFTKFLFDLYQINFHKYEFTQGVSKRRLLLGGLCCIYTFVIFVVLALFLEILF